MTSVLAPQCDHHIWGATPGRDRSHRKVSIGSPMQIGTMNSLIFAGIRSTMRTKTRRLKSVKRGGDSGTSRPITLSRWGNNVTRAQTLR